MKMLPSTLNIYLDVAGRFSKSDKTPFVVAGIAVEGSRVNELRASILEIAGGKALKWSKDAQGDPDKAKKLFRSFVKRQIVTEVTLYRKQEPEWSSYWESGARLKRAVRKLPISMPYAQASHTLKFHVYGLAVGSVLVWYLARHKPLFPAMRREGRSLRVVACCDSDIQDEQSQRQFKEIMDRVGPSTPKTKEVTGLEVTFDAVIKTEEEEPILTVPDYIGGYVYSKHVYGIGPDNPRSGLIHEVGKIVNTWPDSILQFRELAFDRPFLIDVQPYEDLARHSF